MKRTLVQYFFFDTVKISSYLYKDRYIAIQILPIIYFIINQLCNKLTIQEKDESRKCFVWFGVYFFYDSFANINSCKKEKSI